MEQVSRGKFIVVEGSEGAGKSSQLKRLQEIYGDDFVFSREPGGTLYAEEIRNVILNSENASQADAKTLFALFWASRADHMKNKIIPALLSGKNVIVDRFDSSTFAYQIFGQEAQELKKDFFFFRDFFLGEFKPDLYIFMKVDVEVGLSRKKFQQDELNHFDKRKVDFFNRMHEGFDEFLSQVPSVTIDANSDFKIVSDSLQKIISEFLKKIT